MRDTASTACAATPAVDDTLTPRFLRDRRGARPGSRPLCSGLATWVRTTRPSAITTAEQSTRSREEASGHPRLPASSVPGPEARRTPFNAQCSAGWPSPIPPV